MRGLTVIGTQYTIAYNEKEYLLKEYEWMSVMRLCPFLDFRKYEVYTNGRRMRKGIDMRVNSQVNELGKNNLLKF